MVRDSGPDRCFGPFRDALINSQSLFAQYNELKVHLDGLKYDRYTEQKAQFIERVLRDLNEQAS